MLNQILAAIEEALSGLLGGRPGPAEDYVPIPVRVRDDRRRHPR